MLVNLPVRFIETPHLSHTAHRLGTVLFARQGCAVAFRELERITGSSPGTVARAVKELEARGVIRRIRDSFRKPTSYTFLPETNWQL